MDDETRRWTQGLLQGRSTAVGTMSLSANGTTTATIVTREGMSANSVVLVQTSTYSVNIINITPAKDFFTVAHTASTNTRDFRFAYFTGLA